VVDQDGAEEIVVAVTRSRAWRKRRPINSRLVARVPEASWPASPTPAPSFTGLAQRMTALTPIHLHALERLAARYGDAAVGEPWPAPPPIATSTPARWSASSSTRIPPSPRAPVPRIAPRAEALGALDDIDPGSPQDYTLDSIAPTGGPTELAGFQVSTTGRFRVSTEGVARASYEPPRMTNRGTKVQYHQEPARRRLLLNPEISLRRSRR
jgi:hypothetical protein